MQGHLNKNSNIYSEKYLLVEKLVEKIVLKTLVLAELDINSTMKEIIEDIGKIFNCGRCYVRYFDFEQKNFVKANENIEYLKSSKIKSFINGNFPSKFFELMNYTKLPKLTDGILCLSNWSEQFLELHGRSSENINLIKPIVEEYSIKSIYISTLKIGAEIIGSLIIHYTDDFVFLSEEDINFIDVISQKFSYFLRQVLLIEKDKKINEKEVLLRQIIKNISDTKDINKIKNHITTSIGQGLNTSRCLICEYDYENNTFFPIQNEYLISPQIKNYKISSPKNKIIKEAFNQELLIYDSEKFLKDNNYNENSLEAQNLKYYNIKSAFSIPIRYNDKCFGAIGVQYDKIYGFDNEDVNFVRAVSDHLGIAINQAQLYASLEKSMEVEKLLRNLITTLRSTINLDEMLTIICDEIGKAFNADRALIIKCDNINDYTSWTVIREYTICDSVKTHKNINNLDKSIAAFWLDVVTKKKHKSYYIDNVPEANLPEPLKSTYKNLESKTMLGISIEKDDDKWGGLFLSNTRSFKQWSQEEIKLLEDISDQIYIAIKQAELYKTVEKNAKREKLLAEIMTVIKSNLKLDEILIIICNILKQFYEANKIIIKKIDKQEKKLILLKESFKNKKQNFEFSAQSDKYIYKLLTKDRNIIINDISTPTLPAYFKNDLKSKNINSLVITPMYISQNETGAIIIEYNEKKYWDQEDINFLFRVADYVSIAIRESSFYNHSEFISNVSHELKTPISIISGYTNTLLNIENPDNKITKKFLNIIKSNSDRLNNLIENLLFISVAEKTPQLENIVFEKLKVIDLIENSIKLCNERLQSKNISIEKNIENITLKKANSILLQQLIINLITNAINYSDIGSKIIISSIKSNDEILINIQDFGCGIKQEHQANIFERFYRVDKSRSSKTGGTGLGLSISKLISEIHNGYITVKSVFGKGSVFTLHLPDKILPIKHSR